MSLRNTYRTLGALDGSLYLLDQVLRRASGGRAELRRYLLAAQPIGRGGAPLRPDPATELRSVPAEDPLVAAFPRPASIVARRYAVGAHCTAALVRGELAGFIWIQRGRYEEDEVRCDYVLADPQRTVWDFDVYVEPRFRIGRTMARLWDHVDRGLAAGGVRWSFSRISVFNAASLASHRRLGIVECGHATFLCLGPLQLAWLPGRVLPQAGFGARSRPEVRLAAPAD
jgi:hypothetical protein